MKILITIPAFNPPHGGLRVIIEWANRLAQWHEVLLYVQRPEVCKWKPVSRQVRVVKDIDQLKFCDCLIITSPHAIHLQNHMYCPDKVFIFMQMVEHLFRPHDIGWYDRCKAFYTSRYPLIAISQWNIDILKREFDRTGPTYLVGNGVNFEDFPINPCIKDGKTVLIEGWEGYNPAKDTDHVAPRVAARLKSQGYRILAYGQVPLKTMPDACSQYYQQPDLKTINHLYEKATILIKASRYDARSCAPVEAMTKATVTARAIVKGDDDLTNHINCRRVDYNVDSLYTIATDLLTNEVERIALAKNCLRYVKEHSWDYWMERINKILTS